MAALLAFYAMRIAAARSSFARLARRDRAGINEQAIALRGLTDWWQAATQKQLDEKSERAARAVHQRDDGPRPSLGPPPCS
jgi:hypothetical protein